MTTVRLWMVSLGVTVALAGAGVAAAWSMRRYTQLSARNLYPAAAVGLIGIVTSATLGWRVGELVLAPTPHPGWLVLASPTDGGSQT